MLHGLALAAGLVGDGLGGLACQGAALALEDDGREHALFGPVEARQVAVQEAGETVATTAHVVGRKFGIRQQSLSRRVFEECHPRLPVRGLVSGAVGG